MLADLRLIEIETNAIKTVVALFMTVIVVKFDVFFSPPKRSVSLSLTPFLSVSGLNQVVSEQAVDGSSPLDTMIQRLQQEQDQRLGANDASASTAASTRASRGKTTS